VVRCFSGAEFVRRHMTVAFLDTLHSQAQISFDPRSTSSRRTDGSKKLGDSSLTVASAHGLGQCLSHRVAKLLLGAEHVKSTASVPLQLSDLTQ
jgi:hypothetical protein